MPSFWRLLTHKKFQYIILFLAALSIGIHTRLYPLLKFASNDSHEKATLLVLGQLKNQIANQIQSLQPHLTPDQRSLLERNMFQELLQKDGPRVRETIKNVTKNIERYNIDHRDYPYLLAVDSFHFYNLTENILTTGAISDSFKGSKYLNRLMMAPLGYWEPFSAHPYVGFLLYKTLSFFDRDIPLDYALSFTPLFVTALCLIVFYLLAYRLRISSLATFIGSVFFLLSPIFIKRSTFGWYDNDPYNIFFPLLLFLTFSLGLVTNLSRRQHLLIGFFLALWLFFYALFWQGWVFYFCLLIGSYLGTFLIKQYFYKEKTLTLFGWQFLTFVGSLFILLGLTFGPKEFIHIVDEGQIALNNFLQPRLSVWPDLYISVGELHAASFSEIMILVGNPVFLVFGTIGILGGLIPSFLKKKPLFPPLCTLTLILWLTASLYISLGAQRFALLCFTPVSILCLFGMHTCWIIITKVFRRVIPNPFFPYVVGTMACISCLLILSPLTSIYRQLDGLLNPIYNAVWDKSLKTIAETTPKETIVNTWWAPGHFVKATAKRRVTFDGATINHPQAYWMANVFMSQSEVEAAGLLRMLNLSANTAAETLIDAGLKVSEAVNLLKIITREDKQTATLLLMSTLKKAVLVDKVISLTHGSPPPSLLLIFNDFVDKHIQFTFVGKWNFQAIEKINDDPALLKQVPAQNSQEYIQFLWDLVGGPLRSSPALVEVGRNEDFIVFDKNIKIHRKTKDCLIDSKTYGKGIPQSIFYLYQNKIVEKKYSKANLPYSVINLQDGPKEVVYLMDQALANSLLVKLHYFNGAGLNYFKPFLHEMDLTKRTNIHIFEIDWEKFLNDQLKN